MRCGAAARSDEDYRTLARYARALNADVIAFDDGDPPGLKLHRLSAGRDPACWRGTSRHHRYPIDFFVFGAHAWKRVDAGSFRQIVWTDADADPRRGLPSDHCPIAVDLF